MLRRGEEGAERLRLLARVKWPGTRDLLRRAGLKRGMRCLDVGCGIGEVTCGMAGMVGREGEAMGLDNDAAYLRCARREAARRFAKVTFRRQNVMALRDESAFDFVYARYLLTHLREPGRALAGMIRALRPGGRIAVEDVDFSGHICHPACRAFDRYVEIYQAVVRRNGGDPVIGPRLHALFVECGVEGVRLDVSQPSFYEGEGKQVARVTLEHIREHVTAAGLASDAEIDAILCELDEFARDRRTIMSIARTFQVWGQKPK